MIHKLIRGASWRHGLRLFFALCAFSSLCVVTSCMAEDATPNGTTSKPPYFNQGLRWIGRAYACMAPVDWTARRLFTSPKLPAGLTELCVYTWTPLRRTTAPTSVEISFLFTVSQAKEMTEDVPVVLQSGFTTQEVGLFAGLRTALRAQVGDASLVPNFPPSPPAPPAVRVVVIDSAPDAAHGQIIPGVSRHGDTLAHLIEDLVCPIAPTGVRTCAAEVTTALALNNGTGTLSDLASAIERAILIWQHDMASAPSSTPGRLVLNLSLGWEDTPGIADCSTGGSSPTGLPAKTVLGMLQYAASQGALIVAAAGNDSGGPVPRTGLVCPGRYQAVPQDADPSQSLVVAVSGVDYQDLPLQTVRPSGITGIVGLGFEGVAWDPNYPVPPPLTGSSVSTAVVSAVSALVWTYQPSWTPVQVTAAVYNGGIAVGAADACPLSLSTCRSHRASVCGALQAAAIAAGDAPLSCSPAAPRAWSSPDLPAEIAALVAATNVPPTTGTVSSPLNTQTLPRYSLPTVQIQPWIFPMPIEETCPTCFVARALAGPTPAPPSLVIPALGQNLLNAALVVQVANGPQKVLPLGPPTLAINTPYVFSLPPTLGTVQSAYITGFNLQMSCSVTQQIFVQQ